MSIYSDLRLWLPKGQQIVDWASGKAKPCQRDVDEIHSNARGLAQMISADPELEFPGLSIEEFSHLSWGPGKLNQSLITAKDGENCLRVYLPAEFKSADSCHKTFYDRGFNEQSVQIRQEGVPRLIEVSPSSVEFEVRSHDPLLEGQEVPAILKQKFFTSEYEKLRN